MKAARLLLSRVRWVLLVPGKSRWQVVGRGYRDGFATDDAWVAQAATEAGDAYGGPVIVRLSPRFVLSRSLPSLQTLSADRAVVHAAQAEQALPGCMSALVTHVDGRSGRLLALRRATAQAVESVLGGRLRQLSVFGKIETDFRSPEREVAALAREVRLLTRAAAAIFFLAGSLFLAGVLGRTDGDIFPEPVDPVRLTELRAERDDLAARVADLTEREMIVHDARHADALLRDFLARLQEVVPPSGHAWLESFSAQKSPDGELEVALTGQIFHRADPMATGVARQAEQAEAVLARLRELPGVTDFRVDTLRPAGPARLAFTVQLAWRREALAGL